MENVPDILNYGGHNIVQEMVETLDVMGYEARYSLINSAHHGVPQMRDRVFMIAFHKSLGATIRFPTATNRCDLPSGYRGTRSVALKLIDLFGHGAYTAPDTGTPDLPLAITASEAIGDLPSITLHRQGKLKRGARRFTELLQYRKIARSPFGLCPRDALMGRFEAGEGVYDHVLRYLPRDTVIFEAMQPGDEFPPRIVSRTNYSKRRRDGGELRAEALSGNGYIAQRCRPMIPVNSQTDGGSCARTTLYAR